MESAGMREMRDPVFKGCTRPAMLCGVPLAPFVVVVGGCIVLACWGLIVSGWLALISISSAAGLMMLMRQVTRRDDQRLRQWGLRLWVRRSQRNYHFWGTPSYSATRFKRRTGL